MFNWVSPLALLLLVLFDLTGNPDNTMPLKNLAVTADFFDR